MKRSQFRTPVCSCQGPPPGARAGLLCPVRNPDASTGAKTGAGSDSGKGTGAGPHVGVDATSGQTVAGTQEKWSATPW